MKERCASCHRRRRFSSAAACVTHDMSLQTATHAEKHMTHLHRAFNRLGFEFYVQNKVIVGDHDLRGIRVGGVLQGASHGRSLDCSSCRRAERTVCRQLRRNHGGEAWLEVRCNSSTDRCSRSAGQVARDESANTSRPDHRAAQQRSNADHITAKSDELAKCGGHGMTAWGDESCMSAVRPASDWGAFYLRSALCNLLSHSCMRSALCNASRCLAGSKCTPTAAAMQLLRTDQAVSSSDSQTRAMHASAPEDCTAQTALDGRCGIA